MAVCPNCNAQQPDGAAFCDECGAKLGGVAPAPPPPAAVPAPPPPTAVATTCSVCGVSVSAGEAFCDNCGAALGQAAPAAPPPARAAAPAPQAGGPTCPTCGAPLEPGSNFCDMCGTTLGAAPPPPVSPASRPAPVPATAPAVQQPPYPSLAAVPGRLVVQATNVALPFPPGKTEIFVGREDPVSGVFPEVDLTDHGGDEGGVSRKHARVFVQGSQVYIEDLNSTNYTYVNQQKVLPGQPHPLNDGDEVRFGRVKLAYYSS
jgi:hypothetical protein